MYITNVSELEKKLAQNGVNRADVEFIMNLIRDSKLDEDFKIISASAYNLLLDRELWDVFEKSCQDLGIVLNRRNEPER